MKTERKRLPDLSESLTAYYHPACPACGVRHLTECISGIGGHNESVTVKSHINRVTVGRYDAVRRVASDTEAVYIVASDTEAVYIGGEGTPTSVGVSSDVHSETGGGSGTLMIEAVTYECTACGAKWECPYDLAAALAEASAAVWKKKGDRK